MDSKYVKHYDIYNWIADICNSIVDISNSISLVIDLGLSTIPWFADITRPKWIADHIINWIRDIQFHFYYWYL